VPKSKLTSISPGDRIRTRRRELGLSQAELAGRLEISQSALSKLESGNTSQLSRGNLLLLATALDLPPETLDPWFEGRFPIR
jgi:transcriptional regulator with XRE-family HTH domain